MNESIKHRGRPRKSLFATKERAAVNLTEDVMLENSDVHEKIVAAPSRPSLRPEKLEESPRERAARRAAELKQKLMNAGEGHDEFYIDPNTIPDGWCYEWKRASILGFADENHIRTLMRDGGWEPVPADRHPELPRGHKGNVIELKGAILMERPQESTDLVRKSESYAFNERVKGQMSRNKNEKVGEFDPAGFQFSKTYDRVPVPSK